MIEIWRTSSMTSPQNNIYTTATVQILSPIMRRWVHDVENSKQTIYILTILSLAFASVSVVSTVSTLYWFVKMRRSFRHELILLLVQSDFIKSAAFVVFPIVSLYKGPIESDSVFCQASGFVLAVGIESSDIAILLIALHSVMYIFRPRSGLYPYRHLAYSAFYLVPLAAACLAFINGNGFENVGHYCYLRTNNNWSRLALNWVPRYFICTAIISIYLFIYIYIRKRMDYYGRRSSGRFPQDSPPTTPPPEFPAAVIPRISYHGLIPSTPSSRRTSITDTITTAKGRQISVSTVSTVRMENSGRAGQPSPSRSALSPLTGSHLSKSHRPIQWTWGGFNQASSGSSNFSAEEVSDPLCTESAPISPSPPATLSPPAPAAAQTTSSPRQSQSRVTISDSAARRNQPATLPSNVPNNLSPQDSHKNSFNRSILHFQCPTHPNGEDADGRPYQRRMFSLLSILTTLRRGPGNWGLQASTGETLNTNEPTVHFNPSAFDHDNSDVSRNREKIKRQLRSLFVYPLVYMIIWVFPFVSHVMGFDDQVTRNDPEWLLILGILSLSVQGMVDCLLFTVREQPWRHARGRGFFELLFKRWAGWRRFFRISGRITGRTREEILVDGRLARARRDEEIAQERVRRGIIRGAGAVSGNNTAAAAAAAAAGGTPVPQRRREWWDDDLAWIDERDEIDVDGYEDVGEAEEEREARQQRRSTGLGTSGARRSSRSHSHGNIGLEFTGIGSGTGSGDRNRRSKSGC